MTKEEAAKFKKETEQYEAEQKAGDPADLFATNQHYSYPDKYNDYGRRFVPQYPYKENFREEMIANSRLRPVKAPPELVLAVAKQSALLEASKPIDPSEYLIKKDILRSGNYWDSVWREDVDPKSILRSGNDNSIVSGPKPVQGGRGNFRNLAPTQEEEDAFDYARYRDVPKPSGIVGSVAHMVKGALGGGILGGHVAYSKGGIYVAFPLHFCFGLYMYYCLYILVTSAQKLYRRTRIPSMSYPDVGEAAMACFPNPKVAKYSTVFRYIIDTIICIDLFGACACYQLIIAKSIKQLVEDTPRVQIEGIGPGYPELRVYLALMILPVVLICLITHLKWLAPFSVVANIVILFCIVLTVYYCMEKNPTLSGMDHFNGLYNFFEYCGMSVFSMSCSGVVIPIENNMKDPRKYPLVLTIGMGLIILCTFSVSFFGYAAFLRESESPITVNFPMDLLPKILKGGIAVMIYVTHALNFWVPFNLMFYYMKSCHNQNKLLMWELIYRAMFVVLIGIVAIVFPNINALMGFLGAFCLSNMAFIWPNMIYLMTIWQRPGLGKYNWRLWKSVFCISIGIFLLVCGSVVNMNELLKVFMKEDVEKFMGKIH